MNERPRRLRKGEPPEHLTVRETDARYPDQWVLMKVTAFDDLRTPIEGDIVTRGTRRRVYKTLKAIAASGQRPDRLLYLFCAGTHVRSPDEMPDDVEPVLPWGNVGARRGR